jgi:dienelactone hydrolase
MTAVFWAFALLVLQARPAGAGGIAIVPAGASTPAVPVYVARPAGAGPFPAVLLLHGCEGLLGFETVAADRLAARGYVGVALDSLGVRPPLQACGDRAAALEQAADARAVLTWLRAQQYVAADRLAVIGYSMGGNAVLELIDPKVPVAPPPGLRAAVAYYPYCDGRDGAVTVPLQIFAGDADAIAPATACSAMASAGKAAGKQIDIMVYPGATHGFELPGPERRFFGQPIRYDPNAAVESAQKIDAFFQTFLN